MIKYKEIFKKLDKGDYLTPEQWVIICEICADIGSEIPLTKEDYPEYSGNHLSCPENEGYGCCGKQESPIADETDCAKALYAATQPTQSVDKE